MEHDERAPSQEHQMTMEKKDPYCGQKPFNGHTRLPFSAYQERNHETWSVEGDGDTLADLYYLDEETHRRIPLQEGTEADNAAFIVEASNSYYPDKAEIQSLRERAGVLEKGLRWCWERMDALNNRGFGPLTLKEDIDAMLHAEDLLSTSEQK